MHSEGYLAIPLRRRDGSIRAWTHIDAIDVAQAWHRWFLFGSGYAGRIRQAQKQRETILLHRVLLGLVPGDGHEADHINRDKLDNRRENLRVVTRPQNAQNVPAQAASTSHFRGVSWSSKHRRWAAQVTHGGRTVWLGYFHVEEEAAAVARAYRLAHFPFAVEA